MVDEPGGEGDGRVGQPVKCLWARGHLKCVEHTRREKGLQLVDRAAFLIGETGWCRPAGQDCFCGVRGYHARHVRVDAD